MGLNKKDFLLKNGTYNKNFENVKNTKFIEDDFYDPTDIAQVKYEMLKEVEKSGRPITDAADDYGFSRTAYYNIKDAFNKQGIQGLIPEKPGPRKPHKLTPEYQKIIDGYISKNPKISSSEIAELINKEGKINISKRTVERYRAKKNNNDRECEPEDFFHSSVEAMNDIDGIDPGTGIGHEIIKTRGLIEWFLSFGNKQRTGKYEQRYILSKNGLIEAGEEIVVLFANILQRAV